MLPWKQKEDQWWKEPYSLHSQQVSLPLNMPALGLVNLRALLCPHSTSVSSQMFKLFKMKRIWLLLILQLSLSPALQLQLYLTSLNTWLLGDFQDLTSLQLEKVPCFPTTPLNDVQCFQVHSQNKFHAWSFPSNTTKIFVLPLNIV